MQSKDIWQVTLIFFPVQILFLEVLIVHCPLVHCLTIIRTNMDFFTLPGDIYLYKINVLSFHSVHSDHCVISLIYYFISGPRVAIVEPFHIALIPFNPFPPGIFRFQGDEDTGWKLILIRSEKVQWNHAAKTKPG